MNQWARGNIRIISAQKTNRRSPVVPGRWGHISGGRIFPTTRSFAVARGKMEMR